MSCSYVCASCRRRLLQRVHSGLNSNRSSSFVSFNVSQSTPLHDGGDELSGDAGLHLKDVPRRPRSIPEQQPLRSVEDDFLERLLEGRSRKNIQGPYSRPPRKRLNANSTKKDITRAGRPSLPASSINYHVGPSEVTTTSDVVISDAPSGRPVLNLPSQLLLAHFPLRGIRRHFVMPDTALPEVCKDTPSKGRSFLRGTRSRVQVSIEKQGEGFIRKISTSPNPVVVTREPPALNNAILKKPAPTLPDPAVAHKFTRKKKPVSRIGFPPLLSEDREESGNTDKAPDVTFATHVLTTTPSASHKKGRTAVPSSTTPNFFRDGSGPTHGTKSPNGRAFFCDANNHLASRGEKGNKDASIPRIREEITTSSQDEYEVDKLHPVMDHLQKPIVSDTLGSNFENSSGLRHRHFTIRYANSNIERAILSNDTPLAKAWEVFVNMQQKCPIPNVSPMAQQKLCERIVHSWCAGQETGLQLNPSLVLKRIYGNPLIPFDLQAWTTALWAVIVRTITSLRLKKCEAPQPSTQTLVQELMRLWTLMMKRTATCRVLDARGNNRSSHSPSWHFLVASEQMREIRTWFSKDFSTRLLQFFPSVRPNAVSKYFDSAALITFLIFRARCRVLDEEDPEVQDYQPFQGFIAHLLPYSNFLSQGDRWDTALHVHGSQPLDRSFILDSLPELSENTVSLPITKGLPISFLGMNGTVNSNDTTPQHQLEERFKKRIGRAVEHQNTPRLESLWQEIQSTYPADKLNSTKTNVPVSIYRQMLTAFMAVKRPNQAIDTWNAMIQGGIEPMVGAWDAMLKGCGIARDLPAVNGVWSKMIESGVKPDAQVWATRIHSLTAVGDWQAGMQAFRDMTSTWVESVKLAYEGKSLPDLATISDNDGVPKPNTQVVNGLVAGLSRYRRYKELVKILSLARSLGITADIYTFNSLLRSAMHAGNPALAVKLLAQMHTHGLTPDVATFTMILQSLFSHEAITNSSPDEELNNTTPEQMAANVLQQMERGGLQANAWTFATLINGLLKGPSGGNIQAAYAVLSYMSTNGIALSSQIYTAFLTYHFDQKPTPDIAAVETLLNRARTDTRVFLDGYFFDRLIEGFAKCGELGRMTAAMAQAGKRGKVPGWQAMTEVVKAVAAVGDQARLADIIATVKEELQSKDEIRPSKGRKDFMRLAADLGYNEELEIVGSPTRFGEEDEGSSWPSSTDEGLHAPDAAIQRDVDYAVSH